MKDYKGNFVSKFLSKPYRSGMDKELLTKGFLANNIEPVFLDFTDIDFRKMDFKNQYVFYSSSEDTGLHYKSYIEDILLGIQASGGILMPKFDYFRAHHNKVYMEILRDILALNEIKSISSKYFGTIEDVKKEADNLTYPVVIKTGAGAVSSGVALAKNKQELLKVAKKFMVTKYLQNDLHDFVRALKWKGYKKESLYRNKIVVQTLIPNLNEDWKVLVFGKKYYVLNRNFRASGSGLISYQDSIPDGFLDYAEKLYKFFDSPTIAMDLAFDGVNFHLIEYQFVNFGSYTLDASPFYFTKNNNSWQKIDEPSLLEEEFVNSVSQFINKQ